MSEPEVTGDLLFFVVFREGELWVAHGLQHNIVACGDALDTLRTNLAAILRTHLARKTLQSVPPAGPELWERFAYALRLGRKLDSDVSEESVQGALAYEMSIAA